MVRFFRHRLIWKLFFSWLAVLLVGGVVLIGAMELALPHAFARHLAEMERAMLLVGAGAEAEDTGSGMLHGHQLADDLADDLVVNFRAAVTEATWLALLVSGGAALGISVLLTRRMVRPIRQMMVASGEIAQGRYDRPIPLPGVESADLDELGQLTRSFNRMAGQLAASETLRRQLIGDVSHELSTPLSVIHGSLEGLIDGVLPPDLETFQQIQRETARLQRLVTDLQALSRVEAGAYTLNRTRLEWGGLVAESAEMLRRQFEDKGVTLAVRLPAAPLWVMADGDRMAQVVINLVGNGLQYTPAGGSVTVTVSGSAAGVQMAVADTGIGVAADHLPHLFTRFYRVDKSRSRRHGGSGIGLTIARHLVEAHGGEISAESAGPGRGSRFVVSLPGAGN
jgi:histidine kinase